MSVPMTHALGTWRECAKPACKGRGQQEATFKTQDSPSPSKLLNPFPKTTEPQTGQVSWKKKKKRLLKNKSFLPKSYPKSWTWINWKQRSENIQELSVFSFRGLSSVATSLSFLWKQPAFQGILTSEQRARGGAEASHCPGCRLAHEHIPQDAGVLHTERTSTGKWQRKNVFCKQSKWPETQGEDWSQPLLLSWARLYAALLKGRAWGKAKTAWFLFTQEDPSPKAHTPLPV